LITTGCDDHAAKPDSVNNGNDTESGNNDSQGPSVAITPSSQAYFAPQTTVISAVADDNAGISKVRFYNNGRYMGTDYSAPYSHNWSISISDNGSHLWQAKAYDTSGNSEVDSVILDVDIALPSDTEAPSVQISPAEEQIYDITQTVTISASARDNKRVERVEFYHDGVLVESDTASPYAAYWPVSDNDNGSHAWQVVAYDADGNSSTDRVMLDVDIGPSYGGGQNLRWYQQQLHRNLGGRKP
jgi:hypothetical protein